MTITEIKHRLALSMNGICAEKLRNSSLGYAKILGVDWVRIREIATEFDRDYDISFALWQSETREHKLIATLLCPCDEMTSARLGEWMKGVTNTELAEILSFALLSKIPDLIPDLLNMENSTAELERLTAYHALGRLHNFTNHLDESTLKEARKRIKDEDRAKVCFIHAIESLEQ